MKTCDEVQARLSAYLDGEAADQEESIRAHVDSCDACRTVLEGLRHISGRLNDVEVESATLVEDIRRRIREEGPRRRGKSLIPKLAAAAAVLAALLWGAILLGTPDDNAIRLSDLVPSGDLSDTERRILNGEPPTDDEWMAIILSGGSRR